MSENEKILKDKILRNNVAMLFKLQDLILEVCDEDDWDLWLMLGLPDEIEYEDAVELFRDMPEHITQCYKLALKILGHYSI